ncbi:exosporium leader peptide-containing protein, partial [Bacillus cereus]
MSDSNKKSFDLIANEILFATAVDPQLIGPTFAPIPPFTIPTGPTGITG